MVKVYDNIIPDDVCQKLIGIFETNVQHQHFINENNCPCFTQVNLNQVSSDNVRLLIPFLADVYQRYRKDTKNFYSPPLKELEEFRIKRLTNSIRTRYDQFQIFFSSFTCLIWLLVDGRAGLSSVICTSFCCCFKTFNSCYFSMTS